MVSADRSFRRKRFFISIFNFQKYKELVDSTIVVLIAMILLAGYVSLFDVVATKLLGLLTSLGQ